jgi:gluconolactonase
MFRCFNLLGFGLLVSACDGSSSAPGNMGGATNSGGTASGAGMATGGAFHGGGSAAGADTSSGGVSSGGSSSMGAGGKAGTSSSGGSSTGGGESGSSGTSGGGGVGRGGAGGGGAGGAFGSTPLWACPSGVTGKPTLTGLVPARIANVPPSDAFNMNNGTFGNIEGPVWIGDALYVSEMNNTPYDSTGANSKVIKSRILKLTSDGNVSIFVADSGSNGMAVDANGNIVAAVHKDGSLTRFALPSGTPSTVVDMYMGKRFNTPNDLTIRSDGNIYFSDPNFQAPTPLPQGATRVYRRDPSGTVTPLSDTFNNPNGITLSLNEDWLYVAASTGRRYPVTADGSLGLGQDFPAANGGDGMVIDCAGNLYVTKGGSSNVAVYDPLGNSIGTISVPPSEGINVTNVAFGGSDHKTLYITGLQNKKGLFQVKLDIPGRPY